MTERWEPVDDVIEDLAAFVESRQVDNRDALRKALKRWVKREVRTHATREDA